MIIANIEEALKSSKGDPSTVSSARSRIIGNLNKPIRYNPNLSHDYCQHRRRTEIIKTDPSTVSSARSRIIGALNKPIRHNPNLSPDYCQHRRSTES